MTDRNQLLRHARVRRGLTGREVARMVDMDQARVTRLESNAPVTEATLRRYHEAGLITRDERICALLQDAA